MINERNAKSIRLRSRSANRSAGRSMLRATPLFDIVCLLSVLAALIMMATAAEAQPYRPAGDATVIERLPRPAGGDDRELRRLRRDLAADPRDLRRALPLARRYIQLFRAEADPRYSGYAQAALRPWWSLEQPPAEVRVLRAVLRQSRHDFDGALADLQPLIGARRHRPQALLTQAFILQAQGKIEQARSSCRRLPASVDAVIAATCTARMESLDGGGEKAYVRLDRALAMSRNLDDRLRLWALTNLAEIAERRGDARAAENHFRAAVDLGRRDAYLLDAYADLLLEQGRAEEVRDLFKNDIRADGHLLRLALAEQALADPDLAGHVEILAARFEASRRRGDRIHLREEARFEKVLRGRPERALVLAIENWRVQREPWDARLVLETALAAGKPEAAEGVLRWLSKTGLEDVRLQTLAGQVREARS